MPKMAVMEATAVTVYMGMVVKAEMEETVIRVAEEMAGMGEIANVVEAEMVATGEMDRKAAEMAGSVAGALQAMEAMAKTVEKRFPKKVRLDG